MAKRGDGQDRSGTAGMPDLLISFKHVVDFFFFCIIIGNAKFSIQSTCFLCTFLLKNLNFWFFVSFGRFIFFQIIKKINGSNISMKKVRRKHSKHLIFKEVNQKGFLLKFYKNVWKRLNWFWFLIKKQSSKNKQCLEVFFLLDLARLNQ